MSPMRSPLLGGSGRKIDKKNPHYLDKKRYLTQNRKFRALLLNSLYPRSCFYNISAENHSSDNPKEEYDNPVEDYPEYHFSGDDHIYSNDENSDLRDHQDEQGIISYEKINDTGDYLYTKEEIEALQQRIDDMVLNRDPNKRDFLFQALTMYTDK